MDLVSASQAHMEWKVRLRAAISRKERLDARAIAADNRCELGEWLHGEARRQYGDLPEYAALLERHATFHREASAVAKTINAGDYAAATRMLEAGTPYVAATNAVGAAIHGLRRVTP